jgi:putative ABC transport system permease protein
VAGLLAWLPPVAGLPVFGYLSIALLLVGGIALMPRIAAAAFRFAHARWTAATRGRSAIPAVPTLTLARLANASGQAGIALGGVLSSFSLMVAMAIMVASFRVSVDNWILQVLPADLYARVASAGGTAGLTPREQEAIRTAPGIARAEFLRLRSVSLAADRPNVALLARDIDPAQPERSMVLVEGQTAPVAKAGKLPRAWVSEAMADLYRIRPGDRLPLPLAGSAVRFFVAGVWRD